MGDLKKKKKDASDQIAMYKKKKAKAQLDKNTFCAVKRSEVRSYLRVGESYRSSYCSSRKTCLSKTSASVSRS